MTTIRLGFVLVLGMNGALLLAACAGPAPAQSTTTAPQTFHTADSDVCATVNLPATVRPLNEIIREFDDYSELASNIVQSEVVKVIPPMQALRRSAEDAAAPPCLLDLKRYALSYMDATLRTLMTFQQPNPNPSAVGTGIVSARSYHDLYVLELAKLLGVTVAPTSVSPP